MTKGTINVEGEKGHDTLHTSQHKYQSHHEPIRETWETIKDKSSDYAQTIKEKGTEMANKMSEHPAVQELSEAAKRHPQQAILGSIMVLGLLCSFFWWFGGLLVGIAAGLYSPWDLKVVWNKITGFYQREGTFPSFMLGVAGLFLLLHTFSFVVGGLIGLAVRMFIPRTTIQQ